MTGLVNRRGLIAGAAATAVAAALPARVFAQPYSVPEQNRRILAVAKEQMERVRSVLWRTDIVGVADFALPSAMPRLHFADLEKGEVRSFLVAHGKGSDPEHDGFLKLFSNDVGSLATSRGAFITYEWYKGKYGTSIRLGGLDPENSNTLDRAIVMHPAWYANPDMLEKWGKLGRSDGCFAMPEADFNEALWHLSGGRLLYADRLGIY
ncbi:MAG: murein L,D-transpeptidase catalytic domain family protein [Novosphingobium sp.]|uniref:murein L,D-transpeptidase catalytic domain-containing protein n=1 Tax=Novosphingobium sp. NDB2Meth1 TaxID=1892847 RepID=UPI0009310AB6|nr:murein L,D-transpeptidase catalytic domain family protein [Novosphingobium sp. NDB2Meth1]MBY0392640.1 murein L,D-transpeptidase catalytic domain family protein [Novosphingobium sp.]